MKLVRITFCFLLVINLGINFLSVYAKCNNPDELADLDKDCIERCKSSQDFVADEGCYKGPAPEVCPVLPKPSKVFEDICCCKPKE